MKELPEPFQQMIYAQLGEESKDLFSSLLEESPPVSLRVHPFKKHPWNQERKVPWSRWGKYLGNRPVFTLDPLFHAGTYYVQEASSMFLEQAFGTFDNAGHPPNVLDLCASPGGKSTHLLALLNGKGLVVANEVIRSRATVLAENIQKWGYANCVVTNNDPADFQRLPGFFDIMVIDAPCSGEGLFRKDEAAIDEWSAQAVQRCAARQRRILADAWDALREGGLLIYSTCTFNQLENEENLKWLQQQQDVEFVRIPVDSDWGAQEVDMDGVVGYRFFPHRVTGEGFFLSAVRKLESTGKNSRRASPKTTTPSAKIIDRLRTWVKADTQPIFYAFHDRVFFLPAAVAEEGEKVMQNMHVVNAGISVATVKHEKLIPSHALALSVDLQHDAFPYSEIDHAAALQFLRREPISADGLPRGFVLLRFQDTPLGWVNALGTRVNNLYPAEWRIRMKERD